jgi:acetyltransferase-like isoleucine patch superfamily enzyme
MRAILRILQSRRGVDGASRFNDEWSGASVARVVAMLTMSVLRGLFLRPFMGSARGLMLIGKGVRIRHRGHLHVGRGFIAEDYCEVQAISRRGIRLGDHVTIGRSAVIRPTNFYGGEMGEGLQVGNNSNIGPFAYVGCSGFVEIGNAVMIAPRVSIYAENHKFARTDIPMKEQGVERQTVVIEDDCWISANAVILSGVRIGKGTIVAAGSVVTGDVPPYSIVAGVPAKVIRSRKERSPRKTTLRGGNKTRAGR